MERRGKNFLDGDGFASQEVSMSVHTTALNNFSRCVFRICPKHHYPATDDLVRARRNRAIPTIEFLCRSIPVRLCSSALYSRRSRVKISSRIMKITISFLFISIEQLKDIDFQHSNTNTQTRFSHSSCSITCRMIQS